MSANVVHAKLGFEVKSVSYSGNTFFLPKQNRTQDVFVHKLKAKGPIYYVIFVIEFVKYWRFLRKVYNKYLCISKSGMLY